MGIKPLVSLIVFLVSLSIVSAIPVPDYTLYGSATVSGKTLTKEDTNVISLKLDGQELVSFTMGDVAADAYVLRVPMNSERTDGYAMAGDSVRIYVDDKEADHSPVIVGDFGSTVKLDISVSGSVTSCTPNWQCNSWESCSSSGSQSRTCNDLNNCGTTTNMPATSQSCTPPSSGSSGSSGGSSSKSSSKDTPKVTETIGVSEDEPETTVQKNEPVKKTVIISEQKQTTAQEISTEESEDEPKVSLWQKIKEILGLNKEEIPTAQVVSDVPQPKPLIGILIALVIIAFGLLVAYVIIFKLS
jgi:hypothetical protein